jgi:hypothetical protein
MGQTAELADDGRQRRGYDGLVKRREQEREEECAQYRDNGRSVLGWRHGPSNHMQLIAPRVRCPGGFEDQCRSRRGVEIPWLKAKNRTS